MIDASPVNQRRQLVRSIAERLRERIFSHPPDAQIGSLPELAAAFEVGVVTVQQAARILEHEGILEVRRGPGGGYYGRRPKLRDLERALASHMRGEPASWKEVLDITSLFFNRLCAAAARCPDPALHEELARVGRAIADCADDDGLGPLESALQEALFRMVERPLFELLTHVALGLSKASGAQEIAATVFGLEEWQDSRRRIIAAINARDPDLAHFEANRLNRERLVERCGLEDY